MEHEHDNASIYAAYGQHAVPNVSKTDSELVCSQTQAKSVDFAQLWTSGVARYRLAGIVRGNGSHG